MNGIDLVIVAALVLLVGLAVAAGLTIIQERAEAHLVTVSREIREQQRTAPMRYCATCGHELSQPPI